MSIKRASEELNRFFLSYDAEVLCIRGGWGVGKTYALKQVAKALSLSNRIALRRFSYVSLFGIDSLTELKSAIFDNTMSSKSVFDLPAAGGTMLDNLPSVEKAIRKGRGIQAFLPGGWGKSDAIALIDRVAFSFVRNQIVCFDDLERSGKNVGLNEILGVANFLKEERGCKVVIVLNDNKLNKQDKKDYKSQFEKVIDSSIVFEPTLGEVAEIAIDKDMEESSYFEECVVAIGIRNIRVVVKIQRMILLFITECDVRGDDLKQVIATLVLAGWVKYEAGDQVKLDDLKSYNAVTMEMGAHRKDGQPLPEWVSKPNALSYGHSDQVDAVIIDALDRGYVDPLDFSAAKAEREKEFGPNRKNEAFSEAWDLYHGRLDLTDEQIVSGLLKAMRSNYNGVSLLNFNGTVQLFRELGFEKEADEAISEYLGEKDFDPRYLDDELRLWGKEDIDPAIKEYFEGLKADYVDKRDPIQVLAEISSSLNWNPEDIELLVGLGASGLIEVLDKMQNASVLRSALKFLIRFVGSAEASDKSFGEVAEEALRVLSARSTNNEGKIRALGFRPS